MTLLLASASPARRATLQAAGIQPRVAVSRVDEPAVLAQAAQAAQDAGQAPPGPADQVLLLAQAKARDVVQQGAGAEVDLVLGCDSMLELAGPQGPEVLGRPTGIADAITRWRRMRGRCGVLHTGHWLVRTSDGEQRGAVSSTTVHFADLSEAEINAYVASGEPLQVAGAFTIDGLGGPFVERVEGDHHGVVGLSLPLLRRLLSDLDLSITGLWTR